MGADVAAIGARGRLVGNQICLAGSADTMPGHDLQIPGWRSLLTLPR
ncbi:hypothetical protein BF49_0877 [Bradyrhizobium sp.]|jgi:hypothetical protein|nr:hypothetical protein BF49_0877 [Bradyrhizobium sp.]